MNQDYGVWWSVEIYSAKKMKMWCLLININSTTNFVAVSFI